MNKKEFAKIDVSKATKKDLLEALRGLPSSIGDKNLLDRVGNTLKQAAKSVSRVTVKDLSGLVTEAQGLLSAAPAPVEAAKKPAPKKSGKKPTSKPVDEDTDDDEDEPDEEPKKGKKKLGKVLTKKPKTKASGELPCATMFPEEIEFDAEDGTKTLTRVHDQYHTMDDLRKAIADGETLFIAVYWTKRHIKEFSYKDTFVLPNNPKAFPDDLDLLNVVVVCDTVDLVYAVSTYTEAMYRYAGEDFKPVTDTDDEDNEFSVRVCNGAEFEVYKLDE